MARRDLLLVMASFIIMCAASCTNRTNGNLIGSWKSENKDEGIEFVGKTIHMSSTIMLIIREDGTFEKRVDMWTGDKNMTTEELGTWSREGNDVTFTQTNTDSGRPFVMTQTITQLEDDNLVFNGKFEYIRVK